MLSAVDKLLERDVPSQRIHAMTRDIRLNTLPKATTWQKYDSAFHIEHYLWMASLALFFLALIALVTALVIGEFFLVAIAPGRMVVLLLPVNSSCSIFPVFT